MENKESKMNVLQRKSHEALLKVLNNVGIIGAILAAVLDIVFVLIMVFGLEIDIDLKSMIIFAVVNALIGILINVLLRYQGQKYAEIENEELCEKFYNKQVKEKKYLSMGTWMTLQTVKDFLIKGCTTAFTIFGFIYISIQGSKNPIQILLTLATLILFACFGLMGMNSAYGRFYQVQIPYMRLKIEAREHEAERTKAEGFTEETVVAANTGTTDVPNICDSVDSILSTCNNTGNIEFDYEPEFVEDNDSVHSFLGTTDNTGVVNSSNNHNEHKKTNRRKEGEKEC